MSLASLFAFFRVRAKDAKLAQSIRAPRRRVTPLRLGFDALEDRRLLAVIAHPDSFSTHHAAELQDYLTGETDLQAPLIYSALSNPSHGSLDVNSDGSFSYMPDIAYVGPVTFDFQVTDGTFTDSETVSITVTNEAPYTSPEPEAVLHDTELQSYVVAHDPESDTLTFSVTTQPVHGDVNMNSDGIYSYTPDDGYVGEDSFVYTASDGAASAPGTTSITVSNTPPEAYDGSESADVDETIEAAVTGYDVDGDDTLRLEFSEETAPQHGTLDLNADGTFEFIPDTGFIGTDSFEFEVSDGASPTAACSS